LPRPEWAWHHGGVDRVRYWWTERRSWMPQRLPAMVRLPVRRRLPPVPLYGGSQWIVLHRSAYQYVLGLPEDHPVNRAMRHALLPDELYFHTVLANSHLRPTLVRDNLHFIKWGGREHPDVLTEQDLAAIEAEGKLFARKFTADDPLLDIIDERLLRPGLSSSGSR
jgi:hypothetical protein